MAIAELISQKPVLHYPDWKFEFPDSFEDQGNIDPEMITPFAAVGQPELLVESGFGETDLIKIALMLQKSGLTNFAVSNIVHHPDINLIENPWAVEQATLVGTVAVVRAMNEISGRNADTPVVIAGHSGGASSAAKAAHENPELFSAVILNAPVPVEDKANQSEEELLAGVAKVKNSMKRAGVLGLLSANVNAPDMRVLKRLNNQLRGGIRYALQQNGVEIIHDLHDGGRGPLKNVFVSGRDYVSPSRQLTNKLKINGLVQTVGRRGHAPLQTRRGARHMVEIIGMGLAAAALEPATL